MTPPTTPNLYKSGIFVMYMDEVDRFPVRKHPRLKSYDYTQSGYYFITICTKEKRCIFGDPHILNKCGKVAENGLREIPLHFSGAAVDKYTVMPNHIHAIIILTEPNIALPVIIGQYKSAVTKQIHLFDPDMQVWQSSFHDHVIRNEKDYQRIWAYIDANPANWLDDCFYTQ